MTKPSCLSFSARFFLLFTLWSAGYSVEAVASSAPQEAAPVVTTRAAYYPNQSGAGLLQEALIAAESLDEGDLQQARTLSVAAKAALVLGREDIARLSLTQCLDRLVAMDPELAQPQREEACVDYVRAFGSAGEKRLLAETASERDRVTLISHWAEFYASDGRPELSRRLLDEERNGPLRNKGGVEALARLAAVERALGNEAGVEERHRELLMRLTSAPPYGVQTAALTMVKKLVELGELVPAAEILRAASRSEYSTITPQLDEAGLVLIDAHLERNDLTAAGKLAARLAAPRFRVQALARVALRDEPGEERDLRLVQAEELASQEGVTAMACLADEFRAAAQSEQAQHWSSRALEAFEIEGVLVRRGASLILARTLIEGEQLAEAQALAEEEGADRASILAELAGENLAENRLVAARAALDAIDATDLPAALALVQRRLTEDSLVPSDDRERARVVGELTRAARRIEDVGELSLTLAELVASGLPQPNHASALHPWPLPPVLPGGWGDPQAAEVERLTQVLQGYFEKRSLALPSLRAWRERSLLSFVNGRLVEVDLFAGGTPRSLLMLCVEERVEVLEGDARAFSEMVAEHRPTLESDEQILEFACLFTSSIADAKGRFRVLSDALVPIDLVRSDASTPRIGVPSPEILERTAESTRVQLPLLYDTSLLLAEFSVFPDGAVRMNSEKQLVPKLPVDREVLARDTRSFARLRAEFTPLFQRLGQQTDDSEAALEIAKLFATGFGEGGFAIDDDAAQRWLLQLDEEERAAVAYDIGQAFALEKDAPEDVEFALLWFARAADWGHAGAAYDLGAWLVKSNSPLRRESGLLALQRAARADEVRSLGLLGRAQIYGYHGLEVDIESGLALLERAAELGSADSAYLLGLFYAHGTHVSRDPIRASELFAQAETAHPITGYFQGVLRANGYGEAENLTAIRLYEQAAVREVAEAEVVLALRHRSGLGLERADAEKALRWSRRAFERKSRRGGLVLALLLAESDDPKSREEAREVRATVAAWPEPALQLATYLDPVFLEEELPGTAVSAESVLRAWSEKVEQELDRLLER